MPHHDAAGVRQSRLSWDEVADRDELVASFEEQHEGLAENPRWILAAARTSKHDRPESLERSPHRSIMRTEEPLRANAKEVLRRVGSAA